MSATRRIAASIMLMFVHVGRSGFEVKDATAAVVDVDDALVAVVGVALVVTVVAGDVADEEAKSARALDVLASLDDLIELQIECQPYASSITNQFSVVLFL